MLGDQLQVNPTPFALLECTDGDKKLPLDKLGRFRWVSTSIVRFDPSADWPPDLCFKLVINSKLKTHDGIALTGQDSSDYQEYETRGLSMHVSEVLSKKARAVTGDRWQSTGPCSNMPGEVCFHECPMDGIVLLQFSHPVVPSRVLAALTLNKGAGLLDWVRSCSSARKEEQTNATETDTPVDCVAVMPHKLRSDGTVYELMLPRSSRVSPLGGGNEKALIEHLSGQLPFKFRFKQGTIPEKMFSRRISYRDVGEHRPQFRRYRLYLRHGLQPLVAAANANEVRFVGPVWYLFRGP